VEHVAAPGEAANDPAAQEVQVLAPALANWPALHCWQAIAPGTSEKRPGPQSRQIVEPEVGA
jgi:hypothetical protein